MNKKYLILLMSMLFMAGCCTTPGNCRGNDERPPLMNTDDFVDYSPWWRLW